MNFVVSIVSRESAVPHCVGLKGVLKHMAGTSSFPSEIMPAFSGVVVGALVSDNSSGKGDPNHT